MENTNNYISHMDNSIMDIVTKEVSVQDQEKFQQLAEARANLSNEAAVSGKITPEQLAMMIPKKPKQMVREYAKVSRNEPCPCGSGKKYKNCCLDSGKYEGYKIKG